MTTRWAYRVRVLKRYGYLLVFVIPALMPFAAWLASRTGRVDAAAWFPLFFLFVLLPLADYALGRDSANPVDAADIERLEGADLNVQQLHRSVVEHILWGSLPGRRCQLLSPNGTIKS